ncbi:hypothetical protein M0805_006760 [Coniferiporia weirii]|nr:hypothetical protein M0805_006760 [Coniferiporia weirii]
MANSSNYLLVPLSLLPLAVLATNDWSKPCLQGVCSYDIPASENSMSGSISINGYPDQISDITTAAGWEILGCSATMPAQDIRLVCSGDENMCSHLYQNGAENTIVRLPEECGTGPFARVASSGVPEDQSIPAAMKSRLLRRGVTPVVHALSIDMNFDQAPPSPNGDVTFFISGPTFSDSNEDTDVASSVFRRRSRRLDQRGLASSIASKLKGISQSLSNPTRFNHSKEATLPININQQFNIFNQSLSCSNEELGISVDIGVQVGANATLGFVVAGSIIPPTLSKAGVFATLTGNIVGSLDVNANIVGELDSGKIPLFTLPLAGIDIPGIFTLGPSFVLEAEAKATIDLDVDLSIDLAYSLDDLTLYFPQSADQASEANVYPESGPLKLSVSPNVSSNATLEVHLIPTLNVGLSVFKASATVFLDVDTSATLDLGLEAGVNGSIDTGGDTSASAEVDGCVNIGGGVSVDVGAEGSLPGLFDDSTQTSLLQKSFSFFQKCFSESATTTRPGTTMVSSTRIVPSDSATTSVSLSLSSNTTGVGPSTTSAISTVHSSSVTAPGRPVFTSKVGTITTSSTDSSGTATPSIAPFSSDRLPSLSGSANSLSGSAASSHSSAASPSSSAASRFVSAASPSSSAASPSGSAATPSGSTATPSGSTASPSPSSIKRKRGKPLTKKGFSCPVSDIAAAVSVVDGSLPVSPP